MKNKIILIALIVFLLGCEKNKDTTPIQDYVFGLQFNNYNLDLSYINLDNLEITNYNLPIKTGGLYRGVYDGINNYYASVGDTIFEIDITGNTISRKFNSPDTLLHIYNDNERNEIIGVSIVNDTVNIYQLSLFTGDYSMKKTKLQSNSEKFITNVAYNSTDKNLIIKIGDEANIVNVDSGEEILGFDLLNVIHGLRYSKKENRLFLIEFSNNELYFKKYDLSGIEQFSMKLEADIMAFYAENCVINSNDDYIFIAKNKDQNANLIKIAGDKISQKELMSYDFIIGFSYIKK